MNRPATLYSFDKIPLVDILSPSLCPSEDSTSQFYQSMSIENRKDQNHKKPAQTHTPTSPLNPQPLTQTGEPTLSRPTRVCRSALATSTYPFPFHGPTRRDGTVMHGILDFKSSKSTGEFRPYQRANAARTKSGCLSCRVRHTKCDEKRPVCNACVRNHLLCSWPNGACESGLGETVHFAQSAQLPAQKLIPRACPSRALSSWPTLQGRPAEQRLLHYYVERSAPRLIIRDKGHNPFLSYLLPLAQHNDGLLHAILAIGASHSTFDDPAAHFSALSHYAVALRAVKYMITELGCGIRENALQTLLLLLTLCAFEVSLPPI